MTYLKKVVFLNMMWTHNCEEALAKKLKNKTGYKATVYPPMGMRASVAIALNNTNNKLKGFIILTSSTDHVLYYDTGKVSIKYPQGSIGDLNGFGNETKILPDDINAIWEIMKVKVEE